MILTDEFIIKIIDKYQDVGKQAQHVALYDQNIFKIYSTIPLLNRLANFA